MPVFCKLQNPDDYRACDWDLYLDHEARAAWIDIFDDHTKSLLEHARGSFQPPTEAAMKAYADDFGGKLDRLRRWPDAYGPLDIYSLCKLRADVMRKHDIGDPYDRVKHDENAAALKHLPGVLARLDEAADDRVVELLFRAVLAGNKFDLGAKETTEQHARGGLDFFQTLNELPARPWFVDNVDVIAARFGRGACAYRKAIYFVDNAGADVVLGALPIARHLAAIGCNVVLAANDQPSLNDVTVVELDQLLASAAELDKQFAEHLRAGRIATTGTGCDCPLIDLADVSEACNRVAADCDLVILEGMGRAVETNYTTPFTCDAIHVAMIKNPHVAAHVGCRMFDLIVKFTPAVRS